MAPSTDAGRVQSSPLVAPASISDAFSTRDAALNTMHSTREHRIQRWIQGAVPIETEDEKARQTQDDLEFDWELEEFEREIALRFTMRDLRLGLEDCVVGHTVTDAKSPMLSTRHIRRRPLAHWSHTPSTSSTLQPPSPSAPSAISPISSSIPTLSNSPVSPTLSVPPAIPHSLPSVTPPKHPHPPPTSASPTTSQPPTLPSPTLPPAAPDPTHLQSPRPVSLLTSLGLRQPQSQVPALTPCHRRSPSVLSLPASHFSSCTSSASQSEAPPSISSRSLVSQVGRKLKHTLLVPPVPPVPSPLRPKSVRDIELGSAGKKRRRVSVPASLPIGPKKRRLVVRGIAMGDEEAVEGVRRWASGLGEVSRISRGQDGAIWIEFRDRRVADNVCCLHAQVQIPHVGRVVLDWAEGRHPG